MTDWMALTEALNLPERGAAHLAPPLADAATRVADLSTGEEKRLVLDVVLSSGCSFLFLDEPYEHLSLEGKELLSKRLIQVACARVVVIATNQEIPDELSGAMVIRMNVRA